MNHEFVFVLNANFSSFNLLIILKFLNYYGAKNSKFFFCLRNEVNNKKKEKKMKQIPIPNIFGFFFTYIWPCFVYAFDLNANICDALSLFILSGVRHENVCRHSIGFLCSISSVAVCMGRVRIAILGVDISRQLAPFWCAIKWPKSHH